MAVSAGLIIGVGVSCSGLLVLWLYPTRRANALLGAYLFVLGAATMANALLATAPDAANAFAFARLGVWAALPAPVLLLFASGELIALPRAARVTAWGLAALAAAGLVAHATEPRLFIDHVAPVVDYYASSSGPLLYWLAAGSALTSAAVALLASHASGEEGAPRRAAAALIGIAAGLAPLYAGAFFLSNAPLRNEAITPLYLVRAGSTIAAALLVTIAFVLIARTVGRVARRALIAGAVGLAVLGGLDGLQVARPELFLFITGYGDRVVIVRLASAALFFVAAARFGLADVGDAGRRRVAAVLFTGECTLVAGVALLLAPLLLGANVVGFAAGAILAVGAPLLGRAPLQDGARALRDRLLLRLDDPRAVAERARRYASAVEAARGPDGALLPEGEKLLRELRADLGVSEREHELLVQGLASRRSSEGLLLGRYKVEREIGAGATASVLLATDPEGRRVVVKRYHGRAAEAVLREARMLLAAPRHPRVVRVIEVDRRDGEVFLVLEHAAGGSLRDALDRDGPFAPARAAAVVADALDGLAALHERGVVHRDVKLENVLLDADGRAMLGDFGSAGHAPGADATVTGVAVETTFATAAPEVLRGEGATPASDVYSAGAVLYRLLTGEHYVEMTGLTAFDARERVLLDAPRLPHAKVPSALDALLRRALAKRAVERPSAAELRDALLTLAGTPAASAPRR